MNEVERLRRERGFSRYRLAREIGVTEGAVRHWELTGIQTAQYGHMVRLAHILGVPMESLGGGGERERTGNRVERR